MNNNWKKYAANEVKTSNPLKVTIMAYERCILNLRFVKECYEKKDYKLAEKRLHNTEKIIHELSMQLNRDEGNADLKDLVDHLDGLYSWILDELQMLEIKKDPSTILSRSEKTGKEVGIIPTIRDLLDGYRGVK